MKTSIYIEDGVTQIVLTPEDKFERKIIDEFNFDKSTTKMFKGSFKECQGGWSRLYPNENSLIIKSEYFGEREY
jgi:hypothetical protein